MARPKGALNKRTLSVVNMVQPGEVKYFSLEQFLKNRKRTKMGRRSRKNSSQTEGQEQKQCDGVAYFHERRSLNNFHRDRVITFEQIAE